MNDKSNNIRMTSIARSIHAGYWFRNFMAIIRLDLLIALIVVLTYCGLCGNKVSSQSGADDWDITPLWIASHSTCEVQESRLIYELEDREGKTWSFDVIADLDFMIPGAIVLLTCEGLSLFFMMFGAGRVRRKLKPLNDLAVKAEEVSRMDFDIERFHNLEQAIDNVSPHDLNEGIETGDSELQSIEVAINRLIKRMRDAQIQQNRFVSDASHELRTPIAVIQGYVNMLDRWGKQDEGILEESIEALKNESDHMKELVEQLLFLARGDSGRNTLNKSEFDLNDIMQEVYEESVMIDGEHKYEFVESYAPCVVSGDVAMIKQSARIFIQNAAKYSGADATIKIGVSGGSRKSEFGGQSFGDDGQNSKCGGWATFYVQDEGIGMNDSEVSHVFERFYRSDDARNSETGGSGLGLSIAKWIVDAHEGTIDVISSPEVGTRFTVKLPAR